MINEILILTELQKTLGGTIINREDPTLIGIAGDMSSWCVEVRNYYFCNEDIIDDNVPRFWAWQNGCNFVNLIIDLNDPNSFQLVIDYISNLEKYENTNTCESASNQSQQKRRQKQKSNYSQNI